MHNGKQICQYVSSHILLKQDGRFWKDLVCNNYHKIKQTKHSSVYLSQHIT